MSFKRVSMPVLGTTLMLAGAPPAFTADAAATGGLEEIVVTARKREENVMKTPVSVAALSSEDIAVRGITSFNDLANATPGLNINNANSGRNDRSFQQISLRGFTPATTTSTLTASFIDGVPVASATALSAVSDPERVEVLKGPQAAYFGRDTFAGAVNVVTRKPSATLGGSASLMGGSRRNSDISASLEGPLFSDTLRFRLAARTYRRDGSYRNQANPAETLGDQSSRNASLLVAYNPGDRLAIKFFVLGNVNDDGPSAQGQLSAYEIRSNAGVTNVPFISGNSAGTVIVPSSANCNLVGLLNGNAANETRFTRPFICGAVPRLPSVAPAQNTVSDGLLRAILANPQFRVVSPEQGVQGYGLVSRYYHAHLNIDYELGDSGFKLSSLTGMNEERYSELADLDNYDSSLIKNPANLANTNQALRAIWDFPFLVERENRDFSQELRVTYDNSGPLTGLLGVSYLKTSSWNDLVNVSSELNASSVRVSTTVSPPQLAKTTAMFFGATYKFTDALKVSAEGRYQQDKIFGFTGGNTAGLTIVAGNQYGLTPGTYGPLQPFISRKYNNFLPRVIVQYDLNPSLMGYASYSKGVNVGLTSFNTAFLNGSTAIKAAADSIGLGVVVNPEKLTNYEVGVKGTFLDNRLRAQLAIYHAIWNDQLNNRSTFIQDLPIAQGGTGQTAVVSGVANTGRAIVQGIELDLLAKLSKRLTANLAASMNDSDIRSFADPNVSKLTGVIGDGFVGKRLPLASRFSANVGLQFDDELAGVQDGSWFARADLSFKDKQFLDAANLTWISPRSQLNLRAGINKGPLRAELFVINATNNNDYTSIAENRLLTANNAFGGGSASVFHYVYAALPELRTYGAKLTYTF